MGTAPMQWSDIYVIVSYGSAFAAGVTATTSINAQSQKTTHGARSALAITVRQGAVKASIPSV